MTNSFFFMVGYEKKHWTGNEKNEEGRTSGRVDEEQRLNEVYDAGDSQQRTFGEGGQGGVGSIHGPPSPPPPPSPARCWATAGRLAVYSIELSVYSVLGVLTDQCEFGLNWAGI